MSSVDDRIVSMQFDNESFERKLSDTIASLDKLSETIQLVGAQQGFTEIGAAADSVNLSGIASGVDNISSKFSAMGAIAFSALQSITQGVLGFIKSTGEDILSPILSGGKSRATNIDQAKFMFEGLGIDVEAGMASAKAAVLGTAFGLDEAAKAAAQFGASGIQVGDQMTSALRGVAGAAALTGSSFTEIADIFAGSAGSGKVTNMDLMQFSTRGLNAAAAIAPILGKTEVQVHEMATAGTLDFKTFSDAMDQAFGAHATEANKTYTGSLANLHAAMSRMGASFFSTEQLQQRDLFNALTPVIDKVTAALQPLIVTFLNIRRIGIDKVIGFLDKLDFTNFTKAIWFVSAAVQNAYAAIHLILNLVKESFRAIFPPKTDSQLLAFTEAFDNLSKKLILAEPTLFKIGEIFRGLFSILAIGWKILVDTFGFLGGIVVDIAKHFGLGGAAGGILDFFSHFGTALTDLKTKLVDAGGINDFFIKLNNFVREPIGYIDALITKIAEFFNISIKSSKVEESVGSAQDGLNRFTQRLEQLRDTWDTVTEHLRGVFNVLDQVWDGIKTWFSELGSKLAAAFKPGDFNSAVDIINVGLLGGIVVLFKKFLDGGLAEVFGGDIVGKIKSALDGVTNTLKAMQTELKAKALLEIAEALGILVVSIVVLSLIDSAALTKALTAITVGFAQLVSVMTLMDKLIGSAGSAAKLGILAGVLIALAAAIDIMSIAIIALSHLDLAQLAKGLVGVGIGLGILVGATYLISTDSAGLITAGIAMSFIATGLIILSEAVKSFATIGWAEMLKGMVGIATGLIIIATAMDLMPLDMPITATGILILSTGLLILAQAVKAFSTIGWAEMGKGMVGIAGGLVVIGIAMNLMPISLPITAAGIFILSTALLVMADAVKAMGANDLGTIAKGIGAFAAMLIILVIAVNTMNDAIVGAVALIIVAHAMDTLTNVLEKLGKLQVSEIVQGLIAMASVLAVLGLAALILTPVLPEMLLLGIAISAIGAGFALFGIGALLVAKALEALATSGEAGVKSIVASLKIFVEAIPELVGSFATAIFDFINQLLGALPLLLRLIEAVLSQVLDTIIKLAPKIGEALGSIITEGLILFREKFPDILSAGYDFLLQFLKGISDNIGEVTITVANIITNFIDALTLKIPEIATSIYNFIIALAVAVAEKAGEFQTAFIPIGVAFITGMINGVQNTIPGLIPWFIGLPGNILGWLGDVLPTLYTKGIDLITGLFTGILDKAVDIVFWFIGLPENIISWLPDLLTKLVPKGIDLITGFFSGITEKFLDVIFWLEALPDTIVSWIGDLTSKMLEIGHDIIAGIVNGIKDKVGDLKDAFVGAATDGLDALAGAFGIGSPSKKTMEMGKYLIEGLVLGLTEDKTLAKSVTDISEQTVSEFQKALSQIPDSLVGMDEFNPVITPVLDLTKVQADSSNLNNLFNISPITPSVSIQNAGIISTTSDLGKTSADTVVQPVQSDVIFNQNNYSPTALSVNDVYRNTKSQIALAKEELKIA